MIDGYVYKTNKENIDSILSTKKNSDKMSNEQYVLEVLNNEVRGNRKIIKYSVN